MQDRDERSRRHVYEAAVGRDGIQRALVEDLADRAFGGSTASLVMRALPGERARPEELEAWLNALAAGQGPAFSAQRARPGGRGVASP